MIANHLMWDAHACLPLLDDTDIGALMLHREAGADFVSINVGMDFNPVADIFRFIAYFRNELEKRSGDFVFANTLADIDSAVSSGRTAIAFDLEGSMMLQDRPETVACYYDLGVRQIHLAYNRNNSVAGGCHDTPMPLTPLGVDVLHAIEEAGMMLDCSHTGALSSLDLMRRSSKPVCFSHTNIAALHRHGRCVSDEQISACVNTGGVIGISGVNRFIGQAEVSVKLMADQIDYVANGWGVEHVGIGLDYMYPAERDDNPPGLDRGYWWPKSAGYFQGLFAIDVFSPIELSNLLQELSTRGYSEQQIHAIAGGNFYRVAQQTWK